MAPKLSKKKQNELIKNFLTLTKEIRKKLADYRKKLRNQKPV